MYGVLPLWKPKGLTSHDCVQKVRRIFKIKKVGHTGTLDPDVEGVLVLCLGKATKIVPFLTATKKTYQATCTLGVATETEDASGKIVEKQEVEQFPNKDEITCTLKRFQGKITQIPPMYSAVRVKGKRLYEYARENEYVKRPKREVVIYDIHLNSINKETDSIQFEVNCSQGTYIRTLCVDIGQVLGYPSHMSHLIRTETSNFKQDEAISLVQLENTKERYKLNRFLHPLRRALQHLDHMVVDEQMKEKIENGQKLPRPNRNFKTEQFCMIYQDEVLAIYEHHPNHQQFIKPVRVFR